MTSPKTQAVKAADNLERAVFRDEQGDAFLGGPAPGDHLCADSAGQIFKVHVCAHGGSVDRMIDFSVSAAAGKCFQCVGVSPHVRVAVLTQGVPVRTLAVAV